MIRISGHNQSGIERLQGVDEEMKLNKYVVCCFYFLDSSLIISSAVLTSFSWFLEGCPYAIPCRGKVLVCR